VTFTIYYCWDDLGRCLYVGRTEQKLNARLGQHRHSSRWFQYVARVTSQRVTEIDKAFLRLYASDEWKLWRTASAFELAEIRRLSPAFNIFGQSDRYAAIRYLESAAPTERQSA
jgi:hypothetical protein